jgi:hypothetical protein
LREVGKILGNYSGDKEFFLLDFQSFVDFNNEGHDFFHDGSDFMDYKHVKHFQEEFRVNFGIERHFFEEFEDFDEKSVGKIESFLVEFILRDFHVFDALVDDLFVHDVGGNFVDKRGELFSNRLMIDDREVIDFIEGERSVGCVLDGWDIFDDGGVFGLLGESGFDVFLNEMGWFFLWILGFGGLDNGVEHEALGGLFVAETVDGGE